MNKDKLNRLNQVSKQIEETSHAIDIIAKGHTFLRVEVLGVQAVYGHIKLDDDDESEVVKKTVLKVLKDRLNKLEKEFKEG